MNDITPPSGIGTTLTKTYTVTEKDTVGALAPGMPAVASTPWLVTIAEMVCFEVAGKLIEPGQITVGTRVVIDHLGASKLGAPITVAATLKSREKNKFLFEVIIKDGDRTVATVEHTRAAVSLQKLVAALG